MCDCENIEIGSYDNQIWVHPPEHMPKKSGHGYSIDKCLLVEILGLWRAGITTTGHCCGHNKMMGYIGVEWGDIQKMKDLGYRVAFNDLRPDDEDSFIPKSVPEIPLENEWVKPVMEGYQFICCDCGLTHELDFKVVKRISDEEVEDVLDQSMEVIFRARRKNNLK